ncbi:double-stranded RNA-binding protein staufen homolog [Plakobranchus ocellatus]|uniref:Double-stranded RNA-binding protein staufen homolog n=1 Tax=Plakobranchus ocellatus TaxID=259542 RepID=A0AAV4DLE1_9GAST|nr:double-stranded RNA-binding protein staufen homolog [Plakobranchus ocellatus]
MNNQQQHSVINPGMSSTSIASQRTVATQQQRDGHEMGRLPTTGYQQLQQPSTTQMSGMSHFQSHHQQITNSAYQKLKKHQQNGSDVNNIASQFAGTSSTVGVPTQNGNHQPILGSSVHSGLSLENQHSLSHQGPQYHHHHQLAGHHHHHYQHQQIPVTQQQEHPLFHQSAQQHQHPQQQLLHHRMQQQSVSPHIHQDAGLQQQHSMQIHQHLEQWSLHQRQHQRQQQQQQAQPKHILQNPSHAKASNSNQQHHVKPQEPLLVIDTFSANGEAEIDSGHGADHSQGEEKSQDVDETKSNGTSEASEEHSLANTKEKTPMCLINELARYNKVSHQYTLVDEQGPAHKKIFYVKLKLGDEEYSASGESIKKAQHAAAAIALSETGHPHPPPKPPRFSGYENITPTVELNALAMKRGEATTYKAIEPQQPPYYPQPGMDFRGLYGQRYHHFMRASRDRYRGGGVLWPLRYHYPRMNRPFYVSLRVGHREFIGDGPTRQAARHNAAQKALRILKNLPVQNEPKEITAPSEQTDTVADGEPVNANDSLKSEISLVHEVALRRNMLVTFEVIRESGAPHMKTFITRCTVADNVTEGEGNSKKASKKKAAELMLEELQKLPPPPASATVRPKCKVQINKKKNRNIIKSELQQQKADPNYGVGINPISRLIQIMQAQKKKEPVYTLVSERGLPRRREFIMQVEVEEKSCTGTGPNKKLAKRAAAEAMLLILGYTKPSPQPAKSSIKNSSGEGSHSNGDKKVHFVGDPTGEKETAAGPVNSQQNSMSSGTQQRVPGLLHLPPSSSARSPLAPPGSSGSGSSHLNKEPLINLASILKPSLRPELQLRELCKALEQDLEIDDFVKKRTSGTEHITRITVGKEPGQNFHGSSNTLESSRDMAALDALKMLLGKVKEVHPGGDGPQVKKELLTRSSMSLRETK